MQADNIRLSLAEHQRWLTQGLCIYCGSLGHILQYSPTRPPRPVMSVITYSLIHKHPFTTKVILVKNESVSVYALLDFGSAGNFISATLCNQLQIQKRLNNTRYKVQSITGKPPGWRRVRHCVGSLTLQIDHLLTENIVVLDLLESTADIVLGRPWLIKHDPILSMMTGEVLK